MNSTIFNRIGWLIFLLVQYAGAAGQQTTIQATVDRNTILIGEPIQLTLEVNVPATESIRFFSFDTIPHFEFLQPTKIDTINTSNGTRLLQIIPITSFDSGHWVIPSFYISENLKTDSIPIDVGFTPFDPNQEYHDIKDILPVTIEKKKEWWWYIAGGAVLLLVLLYFLFRKKKPISTIKPFVTVPAGEIALKELELLRASNAGSKEFQTRLTAIFRQYLFQKKGVHSLQETTDELIMNLGLLAINAEQTSTLTQALRLSDFVKFAQYNSSAEDNEKAFQAVKDAIVTEEKNTALNKQDSMSKK